MIRFYMIDGHYMDVSATLQQFVSQLDGLKYAGSLESQVFSYNEGVVFLGKVTTVEEVK